jgi:NADH-quinone oxidoreductase subunit F
VKLEFRVGLGSCGIASGGEAVRAAIETAAREAGAEGVVKTVGCSGLCHREPMVEVVNGKGARIYGNLTAETARAVARKHLRPRSLVTRARWIAAKKADTASNLFDATPYLGSQKRIVLENCGEIDPLSIDDYLARDGYQALRACRETMTPDEVIVARLARRA